MSGHTPGPWSSSPQKGRPGNCFMAQVWDRDGKALATIESAMPSAVATANARLIAAAPDLLRACKMVAEMAVGWEALTPGDIAEVRAAIAKAERP